MYTYTRIHTYNVCIHTHAHTHACTHARTHTYTHTNTHGCVHARTHTHTHSHTNPVTSTTWLLTSYSYYSNLLILYKHILGTGGGGWERCCIATLPEYAQSVVGARRLHPKDEMQIVSESHSVGRLRNHRSVQSIGVHKVHLVLTVSDDVLIRIFQCQHGA